MTRALANKTAPEKFVLSLLYCQGHLLPLIHHQNATCGVSCGSIPLRRMRKYDSGCCYLAALHLAPCWWPGNYRNELGIKWL